MDSSWKFQDNECQPLSFSKSFKLIEQITFYFFYLLFKYTSFKMVESSDTG